VGGSKRTNHGPGGKRNIKGEDGRGKEKKVEKTREKQAAGKVGTSLLVVSTEENRSRRRTVRRQEMPRHKQKHIQMASKGIHPRNPVPCPIGEV